MIFAGIGFGFHKAAKEQKRLEQGIAIKRMLYLLQGEIRYGFTPEEVMVCLIINGISAIYKKSGKAVRDTQ